MSAPAPALFERLRAAAPAAWQRYVAHPFVQQMEQGTLPEAAFRRYLEQDYLFLIQYARAWALAICKSRSLADMNVARGGLNAILDEMQLHVRLCARWGVSEAALQTAAEHRATVAYTRYVMDCGYSGDLLDLLVALLPCMTGYAEIGLRLAPALAARPDHPYREWISEYAGAPFQQAAQASARHLDEVAAPLLTPARFEQLAATFARACELEADFWQMGLQEA